MPCDDTRRASWRHMLRPTWGRTGHHLALGAVLSLAACQTPPPSPPTSPSTDNRGEAPRGTPVPSARGTQSGSKEVHLAAPLSPRSWAEARQQAARRLVAANPEGTYMDKPPALLLAIPVMTVELNGDGSVRNISVMRYPSQARDTVKLAMAAIHRAAPYGDVSRLPKPWRFNETFLFKDDRKFKPMTLDQP